MGAGATIYQFCGRRVMTASQNRISWWRTEIGDAEIDRVTRSIREEKISQGAVTPRV